jgi:tetratricopeptide (TPR) repeat protein
MIRKRYRWIFLALALLLPGTLRSQVQILGRIIGQVRAPNGDYPSRQILVELRLHGGTIESVYTDNGGRFGFSNLQANGYRIVINDEEYYQVEERADVNPDVMPSTRLQINLRSRDTTRNNDPAGVRASGGNPYLVNPADYNKRFPKKALKEYERGVNAERKGDHDEAIAHYQSALKIAPEYYPAHNNLGSIYLSKADFKSAEEQFQETVRLDQNDAQAYFNLGNVFLLKSQFTDAEAAVASGLQRRPDSAFGHFLEGSASGEESAHCAARGLDDVASAFAVGRSLSAAAAAAAGDHRVASLSESFPFRTRRSKGEGPALQIAE